MTPRDYISAWRAEALGVYPSESAGRGPAGHIGLSETDLYEGGYAGRADGRALGLRWFVTGSTQGIVPPDRRGQFRPRSLTVAFPASNSSAA